MTTGQLILFGLTGGLLPCPSAFAILMICLQLEQFTLGFALVLAFSVGLALTLVSVGSLAALSVKHASKHFKGFGEIARKAPYVSSVVLLVIGLLIAAGCETLAPLNSLGIAFVPVDEPFSLDRDWSRAEYA